VRQRFRECIRRCLEMFDGTVLESFWELTIATESVSQNRYVPFFPNWGIASEFAS
jgi:hypothetical protein